MISELNITDFTDHFANTDITKKLLSSLLRTNIHNQCKTQISPNLYQTTAHTNLQFNIKPASCTQK